MFFPRRVDISTGAEDNRPERVTFRRFPAALILFPCCRYIHNERGNMLRYAFTVVALGVVFLLNPEVGSAQASKKLKEKQAANPQKESWDQVDKINREADGTRSRNARARKAGKLDEKKYTGGKVTRRHVLPDAPKPATKKQKPTPPKR